MMRPDGRKFDQARSLEIHTGYLKHPDGSVLISAGDTRVICTASIEDRIPGFLKDSGQGWITSEYAMLPAATDQRSQREVTRGRPSGRSTEIQRLIGRCLRTAIDLRALGERTIWIDCDVIQADGGTRTLSITGAFVAMTLALAKMKEAGRIKNPPILSQVAAISVGVVSGTPVLDLCYAEDSAADTDMNVVMTDDGGFIEIQGTAEITPFRGETLQRLLELAAAGTRSHVESQKQVLGSVLDDLRLPPL